MTAAIAIPVTATPAASALKGMVASGSEQAQTAGEGFAEALAALLNGTPQPQVTHTSKAQLAKTETNAPVEAPADPNAAAAILPAIPNLILADAQTSAPQTTAAAQINAQAAQTSAVQVLQAAIKGEPTTAANDETTPAQPQTATPAAPAAALAALAANAQQQTQAAPATAKTPVKAASKEAANKPQLETASANSTTPTTESKVAANSYFVSAIEHALSNNSNGNSQNGNANSNQSQLPATASPVAFAIHTTMVDTTAATAPAATAQAQVAVPVDALAVHIARKFEGGENRFEIRLDPIELGKLDISMSVDHDGRVSAVVRAERPETLDMLQRDARLLESQLRQSGLNVDSNSLSFSLGNGNDQRSAFAGTGQSFANAVEGQPEAQAATATTTTIVNVRDGVDIRI